MKKKLVDSVSLNCLYYDYCKTQNNERDTISFKKCCG